MLTNWLKKKPQVEVVEESDDSEEESEFLESELIDLSEPEAKQRKRKIRHFQTEWQLEYFVVSLKQTPWCLICKSHAAKEYHKATIARHFNNNHKEFNFKFPKDSAIRKKEFEKRKQEIEQSSNILYKAVNANVTATQASFKLSYILARERKPFTYGEEFKAALLEIHEDLFATLNPNERDKVKVCIENLPASDNTMRKRLQAIGEQKKLELKDDLRNCVAWSVALDSSADIKDMEQLVIWVNFASIVNGKVIIKKEYLVDLEMNGRMTGSMMFERFDSEMQSFFDLDYRRLVSVGTDGCPSMIGDNNGFIGHLKKKAPQAFSIHCIIHLHALAGKVIDLDVVMGNVVAVIREIKGEKLRHRQFQALCDELESNYGDVLYFTAVRWLSKGKCLVRFIELIEEIRVFLIDIGKADLYDYVYESNWLCQVKFLADVVTEFNVCNMSMQKKDNTIIDLIKSVEKFKRKILKFKSDVMKTAIKSYTYLSTCTVTDVVSNKDNFIQCIENIEKSLEDRFGTGDYQFLRNVSIFMENTINCEKKIVSCYVIKNHNFNF